ncbi:thioesterase superfamily protein [Wolffia australiana]
MEQRVRDFLRGTEEAEKRVAALAVEPQLPGVSPSFYGAVCTRDIRVDLAEPGLIRCFFRVTPLFTDAEGNLSRGAIANLVDELGGYALMTLGHHTKVSVNISIAYLSTARLDDELEITSRVLGHKGAYSGTAVTLMNKRTREMVAEGRHSLFGKQYSNI